jgi:hypothetical protein
MGSGPDHSTNVRATRTIRNHRTERKRRRIDFEVEIVVTLALYS